MNHSKTLWILLIAAILLGSLWQFYPLPDARKRIDNLPLMGPGFVGQDVPLNDFEQSFFKGVYVLKRIYRVDGNYYFLTVLDGTHNRHVVHDPYYCFTGSGWQIDEARQISIENGTAEQLLLSKGAQNKTALFWFADGTRNFSSPWNYWLAATWRRLTLGASGQEPVLIMIQPLDSTTDVDWSKILKVLYPVTSML